MFWKRLPLLGIIPILLTLLTGCNTVSELDTDVPLPQDTEQIIDKSKSHLAQRLDITEENIQLVSIEGVDFPDTSLGVPEPGMFYAEVITPGYIIKLEALGQVYQYNTDRQDTIKPCQNTISAETTDTESPEKSPPDISPPIDDSHIHDREPWMPVD